MRHMWLCWSHFPSMKSWWSDWLTILKDVDVYRACVICSAAHSIQHTGLYSQWTKCMPLPWSLTRVEHKLPLTRPGALVCWAWGKVLLGWTYCLIWTVACPLFQKHFWWLHILFLKFTSSSFLPSHLVFVAHSHFLVIFLTLSNADGLQFPPLFEYHFFYSSL